MADVVYVAVTVGAFAGLVGLVRLCDAIVRSGATADPWADRAVEEVAP